MKQDKVLQVCYEDQTVGTLAMTADHKVAFQYSDEWLETGFWINPFLWIHQALIVGYLSKECGKLRFAESNG